MSFDDATLQTQAANRVPLQRLGRGEVNDRGPIHEFLTNVTDRLVRLNGLVTETLRSSSADGQLRRPDTDGGDGRHQSEASARHVDSPADAHSRRSPPASPESAPPRVGPRPHVDTGRACDRGDGGTSRHPAVRIPGGPVVRARGARGTTRTADAPVGARRQATRMRPRGLPSIDRRCGERSAPGGGAGFGHRRRWVDLGILRWGRGRRPMERPPHTADSSEDATNPRTRLAAEGSGCASRSTSWFGPGVTPDPWASPACGAPPRTRRSRRHRAHHAAPHPRRQSGAVNRRAHATARPDWNPERIPAVW